MNRTKFERTGCCLYLAKDNLKKPQSRWDVSKSICTPVINAMFLPPQTTKGENRFKNKFLNDQTVWLTLSMPYSVAAMTRFSSGRLFHFHLIQCNASLILQAICWYANYFSRIVCEISERGTMFPGVLKANIFNSAATTQRGSPQVPIPAVAVLFKMLSGIEVFFTFKTVSCSQNNDWNTLHQSL